MKSLSKKQIAILRILVRANPTDGTFCDLDELLDRLPYKTTKESVQFSIRALEKRGLIEKKPLETRRGQGRRVLAPTIAGYSAVKAAGTLP